MAEIGLLLVVIMIEKLTITNLSIDLHMIFFYQRLEGYNLSNIL